MGFKDLKALNMVLLAKQGWQIFRNPNSLLHNIYKARYFAKTSFMEAQVGKNPYYAWRSIIAARNIIDKSLIWTIGNGKQVKIWKEGWLPTHESFEVVSPQILDPDLERVENLLDVD